MHIKYNNTLYCYINVHNIQIITSFLHNFPTWLKLFIYVKIYVEKQTEHFWASITAYFNRNRNSD